MPRTTPFCLFALTLLSPAALLAQDVQPTPAAKRAPEMPPLETQYPNKAYIDAVNERASHASLGYALGRHGDGFVVGIRYDQPVVRSFFLRFHHYTNLGPFSGKLDPVLGLGVDTMFRSPLIFGIFRVYGGGGFGVGFRPSPTCRNPVDQSDVDAATARAFGSAYVRATDPDSPAGENVDPSRELTSEKDQAAIANQVRADIEALRERCREQKDAFSLIGGGYSGIEFFSGPIRGFYIEIGGGGGGQRNDRWRDSGLIVRAGSQFYF